MIDSPVKYLNVKRKNRSQYEKCHLCERIVTKNKLKSGRVSRIKVPTLNYLHFMRPDFIFSWTLYKSACTDGTGGILRTAVIEFNLILPT